MSDKKPDFSDRMTHGFPGHPEDLVAECRYGENPYMTPAGLYTFSTHDPLAVDKFQQVEGAPLSYNNWTDVDRALQTITHTAAGFDVNFNAIPPMCFGLKHGNACGGATAANPMIALESMIAGDPRALFGGVVITNFFIDEALAMTLRTHMKPEGAPRNLQDILIAPGISESAREALSRKNGAYKMVVNPALSDADRHSLDMAPLPRYVRGGVLWQPNYSFILNFEDEDLVAPRNLAKSEREALMLAWAVGATSNSNTVCLTRSTRHSTLLIGNGMGQMDRVTAARHAIQKAREAGHETRLSYAYSDSFFPFPDGALALARPA